MQSLLAAARNGDEAAFVGMLAPLLEEAHRLAFAVLQNQHELHRHGRDRTDHDLSLIHI